MYKKNQRKISDSHANITDHKENNVPTLRISRLSNISDMEANRQNIK